MGAQAEATLRLGEDWHIRPTDELLKRLEQLTGGEGVRVDY